MGLVPTVGIGFAGGASSGCQNVNAPSIYNVAISYGKQGIHQGNFYTEDNNQSCSSATTGASASGSAGMVKMGLLQNLQMQPRPMIAYTRL